MTNSILKQTHKTQSVTVRDFAFPHEVVDNPAFSIAEKRDILCEWASDRCAVESFPTLRWLPGTTFPVTFSAVMDALAHLDRAAARRRRETAEADDGNGAIIALRYPTGRTGRSYLAT